MSESANGLSRLWSVDRDAKRVAAVMIVALCIGAALVMAGTPDWKTTWIGLLWASACSAGGWFLGFLFGIPRSLSSDTARTAMPGAEPSTPSDESAPEAEADQSKMKSVPPPSGASTAVNTNLEQISDWLTKIIVGVTLVESKEVIHRLEAAGRVIGQSLGGPYSESFAMALLIYFFTAGLLGSYLLTRLFLQRAFNDASMSGR
jgi:hypothetical protein